MKKILLSTTALVFMAGAASAADLPRKAPYAAPAAVPYAFNWSGCYVGVQGGFTFFNGQNSFSVTGAAPWTPEDNNLTGNGGMVGAHLGCNWQAPGSGWVLGLEGDGEWARIKGNDGGIGGQINELSVRWMASARGRVGYAWGRTMWYATAGAAFAGLRSSVLDIGAQEFHQRNDLVGGTVGTGLEFALSQNWSARIEYRFTSFGTRGFNMPLNGYVERHEDIHLHQIRGGFSYRWGGAAPVMASY
jgi:outer membrane immunogenic protein